LALEYGAITVALSSVTVARAMRRQKLPLTKDPKQFCSAVGGTIVDGGYRWPCVLWHCYVVPTSNQLEFELSTDHEEEEKKEEKKEKKED